jgi:hypothetical protein
MLKRISGGRVSRRVMLGVGDDCPMRFRGVAMRSSWRYGAEIFEPALSYLRTDRRARSSSSALYIFELIEERLSPRHDSHVYASFFYWRFFPFPRRADLTLMAEREPNATNLPREALLLTLRGWEDGARRDWRRDWRHE